MVVFHEFLNVGVYETSDVTLAIAEACVDFVLDRYLGVWPSRCSSPVVGYVAVDMIKNRWKLKEGTQQELERTVASYPLDVVPRAAILHGEVQKFE